MLFQEKYKRFFPYHCAKKVLSAQKNCRKNNLLRQQYRDDEINLRSELLCWSILLRP